MINVTSETLTLNFVPRNDTVTFVNGIEVVSVPDDLISDQALVLSASTPFNGLSEFALETVYRLNMGGPLLTPENDTLGRTWENDGNYLHVNSSAVNVLVDPATVKYPVGLTTETAPNWVYATAEAMANANVPNLNFNVTWVFSADPDFIYFVRLHFCEIVSKALNDLVFNVYINSNIVIASLDLSAKTGDLAIPYYKDFISNSTNDSRSISVSVGPDVMADTTNAILNGLEIMKISNGAGSLDGSSSVDGLLRPTHSKKTNIGIIIGIVVGISAAGLIAGCYCCFVARKQKTTPQGHHPWLLLPLYGNSRTMTTTSQKSGTASFISMALTNLGHVFTFQEIMDSTNKFDDSLVLGVGGFGKVYKGTLEDGTKVAVKRGNPRSEQGLAEFHTEIEMLSKLRHRHLVSLIGYCDERPALNPVLPREQVNIAEWAMNWQKEGMLDQIMDSALVGKINPASLKKFGETAEKCLPEYGVDRPTMGDVLWNLEYALQLDETSSLTEIDENSTNHIANIPLTPLQPLDNSVSVIDGINSGTDDDAEDVATSAVFSQLVNPRGR
ncbi:hypothetical protein MRB53_021794 [Persea americana]|uniref:Uncharacterized protein n=1 Tax=Persea americana TaxID=3435 RepID=A0ACC2L5W1_PERAE|nr:hypothetical protein MRB53_021794 [Persea americana]